MTVSDELLHALVSDVCWQTPGADCLEAYVREIPLSVHSPDMPDSVLAHALRQRNEGWKDDLPDDEDALWRWIDGLDDASRMAVLAHCRPVAPHHAGNDVQEKKSLAPQQWFNLAASGLNLPNQQSRIFPELLFSKGGQFHSSDKAGSDRHERPGIDCAA